MTKTLRLACALLLAVFLAGSCDLLFPPDGEEPELPGAPTGLAVSGAPTTSSISLVWNAVAGALGYRLYRSSTLAGTYTQIGADLASPAATDSGLSPATTYYYKVSAFNADGEGELSSAVNGTTAANPGDTTPPDEVSGQTATPGDAQIVLAWMNPLDEDFDHVEITWTPAGGTPAQPAEVAAPGTGLTVTGLANGSLYTFTLKTVDTTGNASAGLTAVATPAAAPALGDVEKRDMINVTGGTYTQSDTFQPAHSFRHTVSSFKIAAYEVTYELWYTVRIWAAANGYSFGFDGKEGQDGVAGAVPTAGCSEPVTDITWKDILVWTNAYSEMAGLVPVYENASGTVIKDSTDENAAECDAAVPDLAAGGYRMPTEGEWQYAASNLGATPANYAAGASAATTDAAACQAVAWYSVNAGGASHNVGGKTPNALGLYDMSGNVLEFCWDWNGDYPGASTDYRGLGTGTQKIYRGGCWNFTAGWLGVGYRASTGTGVRSSYIGFRVAQNS